MAKKKKKEKIVYIDDGRTVADMSHVPGTRLSRDKWKSKSTGKEKWDTYWGAVKMMFGPMMVVICAIVILYMILWAVFFFIA